MSIGKSSLGALGAGLLAALLIIAHADYAFS